MCIYLYYLFIFSFYLFTSCNVLYYLYLKYHICFVHSVMTHWLHVYRISDTLVGLYFNVIKWVIHSLPNRTEPNPSLPGHRTLGVPFHVSKHALEGRVWLLRTRLVSCVNLCSEMRAQVERSSAFASLDLAFFPIPLRCVSRSSFYAHIIVRNSDAVRLHPAYSLSDIIRFIIIVQCDYSLLITNITRLNVNNVHLSESAEVFIISSVPVMWCVWDWCLVTHTRSSGLAPAARLSRDVSVWTVGGTWRRI